MSISRTLGVYHEVVQSQQTAQEDHSNHNHSHDDQDDDSHDSHKMLADVEPSSKKVAHYDVDHTSSYLLLNTELELVALLTNPHEPAPMAEALDKVIEAL